MAQKVDMNENPMLAFYKSEWRAVWWNLRNNRKPQAFAICHELIANHDLGVFIRAGCHQILSTGHGNKVLHAEAAIEHLENLYDVDELKIPGNLEQQQRLARSAQVALEEARAVEKPPTQQELDQAVVEGEAKLEHFDNELWGVGNEEGVAGNPVESSDGSKPA